MYFYNIQAENVEYCNSFLGGLQGSLDPGTAQTCSNAGAFQAGSMGGMLLGGALAIIGLILVILGAIQGGKKKDVSEKPMQTSISSPQQEFHSSPRNTDTIYCRYCGELRPRRDESCALCGRKSITSSTVMKQCVICAAIMSEDSIFCANCGAKFQESVNYSSVSTPSAENKSPPLLTFEAINAGVKIQYPSNWYVTVSDEEMTGITFSAPAEKYGDENTSDLLITHNRTNRKPIDDNVQERIETIRKQYQDVKFLESSNRITLSGRPAYKLVYIIGSIDGGSLVKRMEIGTIVDKELYILNGGSRTKYYSDILPILERMISSFELIKLGGDRFTKSAI